MSFHSSQLALLSQDFFTLIVNLPCKLFVLRNAKYVFPLYIKFHSRGQRNCSTSAVTMYFLTQRRTHIRMPSPRSNSRLASASIFQLAEFNLLLTSSILSSRTNFYFFYCGVPFVGHFSKILMNRPRLDKIASFKGLKTETTSPISPTSFG